MHRSVGAGALGIIFGLIAGAAAGLQFWALATSWWTFVAPALWIFICGYCAVVGAQNEIRAWMMFRSVYGLAVVNFIIWIIQIIVNYVLWAPLIKAGWEWALPVPPIMGFVGSIGTFFCAFYARRSMPDVGVATTTAVIVQPTVVQAQPQPVVTQTTTTYTQDPYAQPVYAQQQPVYGQPAQPVYGQPGQPVYGQQQPVYGQQPMYDQSPYGKPM